MKSSLAVILVLAAVLGGLEIHRHWRAPAEDRIFRQVSGVSEITLQFDSTDAGGVRGPVMGLGYARWVNFPRILYGEESFYQVGSDASLIVKDGRPTRYVVREGFRLKSGIFGSVRYATLTVEDVQERRVIATKEWRCNDVECRYTKDGEQGWPGQHGAQFVRDVLNPTMPIGGNVGIKPYPTTVATTKQVDPATRLTRAELTTRSFGCPDDLTVYVRRDINRMVVARRHWTFVPAHMTRQVRCNGDGIFVFSTTFPTSIFLDWLSLDGKLLGQYYVHLGVAFPASGGGTFPYLAAVTFQPEAFELRMAYFHDQWPSEGGVALPPQWEYLVKISRTQSAQRHAL